MVKEEVIAGIKNAIERGYTLEQAKQTFINAGYNQNEIESAVASIGGIMTQFPRPPQLKSQQPKPPQIPAPLLAPLSPPLPAPLPVKQIQIQQKQPLQSPQPLQSTQSSQSFQPLPRQQLPRQPWLNLNHQAKPAIQPVMQQAIQPATPSEKSRLKLLTIILIIIITILASLFVLTIFFNEALTNFLSNLL